MTGHVEQSQFKRLVPWLAVTLVVALLAAGLALALIGSDDADVARFNAEHHSVTMPMSRGSHMMGGDASGMPMGSSTMPHGGNRSRPSPATPAPMGP
jgi:hypothetical protein